MLKKRPASIAFLVLLIVSLACSQSGNPAPVPLDPNIQNTSIAQTIVARQTEVALTNPPTATLTAVPASPTVTAGPTFTLTPDFTPTPLTPLITVSKDTNCRTGPSAIYERVGMLLVGEVAEVIARNNSGEYWYIRNPDVEGGFCWVWGKYATLTGNVFTLLLYTPAPAPSTVFSATFASMKTCTTYWANFQLENPSDALFQSISIELTDSETNTVVTMKSNDFIANDDCKAPTITDYLVSGGTTTVSSSPLVYNPKGHSLNARIKLCTLVNEGGTCVTKDVPFKAK
ncbi:MAG: SH3 domain-containing protein [Anaerolineales bacterium]|nr:SH3 domain-containing protein [Anaerolineales bacterium]